MFREYESYFNLGIRELETWVKDFFDKAYEQGLIEKLDREPIKSDIG